VGVSDDSILLPRNARGAGGRGGGRAKGDKEPKAAQSAVEKYDEKDPRGGCGEEAWYLNLGKLRRR